MNIIDITFDYIITNYVRYAHKLHLFSLWLLRLVITFSVLMVDTVKYYIFGVYGYYAPVLHF